MGPFKIAFRVPFAHSQKKIYLIFIIARNAFAVKETQESVLSVNLCPIPIGNQRLPIHSPEIRSENNVLLLRIRGIFQFDVTFRQLSEKLIFRKWILSCQKAGIT